MRRSSENKHRNENSTKENSFAAPKRSQKPMTPTVDTDREAITNKSVAAKRNSRKRNSDNNLTTKQIAAYSEDVSMVMDELGKTD